MDDNEPIFAGENEPPPTWVEMREDGNMVVDEIDSKLAAYVGGNGYVVVMSQGFGDDDPHYMIVHHKNLDSFIAALQNAKRGAEAEEHEFYAKCDAAEREYAAWAAQQQQLDA